MSQKKSTNKNEWVSKKRKYESPQLTQYGNLSQITHSDLPGMGDVLGGTGGDQT